MRHSADKKKFPFRRAKAKSSEVSWEIYNAAAKSYKQVVATVKKTFCNVDLPNMLNFNLENFWQIIIPKLFDSVTPTENGNIVTNDYCA